jgi:hypothetical protein
MESDFNTQNKLVVSGNAVDGAISMDENELIVSGNPVDGGIISSDENESGIFI